MMQLRLSTQAEMPLQASKWLQHPMLVDALEMESLFDALEPFMMFRCGCVTPAGEGALAREDFLKRYTSYVESLKSGVIPDSKSYSEWFSPALTVTSEALYAIPVSNGRQLIRIARPVVQMQAHNVDFSPIDKKFRSMVYGEDNIPWGVQFSYPQLYQDNDTKKVEQVRNSENFPNSKLFQTLQRWVRQNTVPTPFQVEGTVYHVPMRLGKRCFSWINQHPQLVKKGITVKQ